MSIFLHIFEYFSWKILQVVPLHHRVILGRRSQNALLRSVSSTCRVREPHGLSFIMQWHQPDPIERLNVPCSQPQLAPRDRALRPLKA